MYKAVIQHSDSGIVYSDNKRGNRVHNKSDGKFASEKNLASGLSETSKTLDRSGKSLQSMSEVRRKQYKREISEQNKKKLDNMSDEELRKYVNRKDLERRYNDLYESENVDKGQIYIDSLQTGLTVTGLILAVAGSALTIYMKTAG